MTELEARVELAGDALEDAHELVPAGLDALAALERGGAVTPTALLLPLMEYEQWEAVGRALGRVNRTLAWLVGDWLNAGEAMFGEKYAQAADATGLHPQTLINYAWTCRAVPPERRRADVPFSLHRAVAPLEPEEQSRYLAEAAAEGLTRTELEERLHGEPEITPRVMRQLPPDARRVPCPFCDLERAHRADCELAAAPEGSGWAVVALLVRGGEL